MNRRRRIAELTGKEYLPMLAMIALWALVVAVIGHADAARLLAAVAGVRALQLLTKFSTGVAVKRRMGEPPAVMAQARRYAFDLQLAALVVAMILLVGLAEAMKAIGQQQIAAYLPYLAVGVPARYLRLTDHRAATPYSRLALSGSGLFMVIVAWAAGWDATLFALAFGAREWIAYLVLRWWPTQPRPSRKPSAEPLRFPEVATLSAVIGRRLLTYRLSKAVLTLLGPFGTVAARTGRGLNWHTKIEPYLPHHLGGFILFSVLAITGAVLFALHSGEPAAMVAAAGLLQIGSATTNVVLLWRYLPQRRKDGTVPDDDDEE